jgi:hypothetical protein
MPIKKNPSDAVNSQSVNDSLIAEINALRHELRRIQDGLERVGGVSPDLEKTAQKLSSNIQLCESELEKQQGSTVQDTGQGDLFAPDRLPDD